MPVRPLAVICLAIALMSPPAVAQPPDPDDPSTDSAQQIYELGRFAAIYQRILSNYVDEPDPRKLIEAAIDGMVGSLDPHSRYVDARAFRDMQRELTGKFAGLGIEVSLDNGAIVVKHALEDSPAAKAGLLAGDIILSIDGTPLRSMSLDDVLKKMQGAEGTTARLSIQRAGRPVAFDLDITRAIIATETVQFQELGRDVGYIRIVEFDDNTFGSLHKATVKLQADIKPKDLKGYIVDLRNNPGGLLDQAITVSAGFVGKGVVVSVRGRDPNLAKIFIANGADLIGDKPVIVLINGGTASAAEIVAGALQDLKRATILGTRSFGKGSVQTVSRLADESALILTTARYYTPLGRSIQAEGIEPDILILQSDAEAYSVVHRTSGEAGLAGHLKARDGEEEGGGSSFYVPVDARNDTQLNAALDLLRGLRLNPAFPPRRLTQ
ncbi:S41 family peptidase [Labrys okinawensis]|uniref:S41 family peptidase n=1 Tax=Labrys okinawensis TaxID=346911 RepID=UPI0039BCCCFF